MFSHTALRSSTPYMFAIRIILGMSLILFAQAMPAMAQTATTPASPAQQASPVPAEQPPAVNDLLRLLADPQVQQWLKNSQTQPTPAQPAATTAPATTAPAALPASVVTDETNALAMTLTERLAKARKHIYEVIGALPNLPTGIAVAGEQLHKDARSLDTPHVLLRVLLSVGLGVLFRFGFVRYAGSHTVEEAHAHLTPGQRLKHFLTRMAFAIGPSIAFAVGALIPFLVFDWSPLIKHTTLNYLIALLAIQLIYDLAHALLIRATDDHRSLYDRQLRHFWFRRIVLFLGYFVLAWATVGILIAAGAPHHTVQAIAYILGLVQLGIALEAIWRRPLPSDAIESTKRHRFTYNILLSLYGVLLWMLWASSLNGLFWIGVFVLLIPTLILANGNFVRDVIRPSEGIHAERASLIEVGFERGIRVLIIVAAVFWLAHIWELDLIELTSRDTTLTRLVRGVLNATIVLLLADFLWQIARTIIDMRLAGAHSGSDPAHPDAAHEQLGHGGHGEDHVKRARLRTLLPIFRNILLVAIILIACLMALSELGIQIAPLIAGAGVVGVAVGFGSQTIVKDVISGVFYLLDDAFRVGEYIQSGHYKGTVESFSLRSVKLRHQRGPIYTVPFGQLGAVQNMSRDWVYDKFQIGVAYDTDLEQARKIIKNIGIELAANPDFAPHILESLKMQGVQEFGQYGVEIRCKIKTRPGEQFVIRRTALKRIKQEFDAAGIKFALPSMQVASGVEPGAAAMQVHRAIEAEQAAAKE